MTKKSLLIFFSREQPHAVDDLECENAGTLTSCDAEYDACEGHPPHGPHHFKHGF